MNCHFLIAVVCAFYFVIAEIALNGGRTLILVAVVSLSLLNSMDVTARNMVSNLV